jgi:Na+:H+ antiporter, NhaC family
VPWNTCGAYISGVLGVSTASYFPICFFNFLSPMLDVIYGFVGFKVSRRATAADAAAPRARDCAAAKDEQRAGVA